jgi:hypothetical protein
MKKKQIKTISEIMTRDFKNSVLSQLGTLLQMGQFNGMIFAIPRARPIATYYFDADTLTYLYSTDMCWNESNLWLAVDEDLPNIERSGRENR